MIYLWALDARLPMEAAGAEIDGAVAHSTAGALHLVQALTGSGCRPEKGLWFVTRAAQTIGGDEAVALAQAPLWGLGRVVAQEHPELQCRLLDLDAIPPDDEADQILAEVLTADDSENQRALRAGKTRHVLRLAGAKPSLEFQRPPQTREGTYLITGGMGGLGLEVAGWLVRTGVRHLALLGRHAPSERAEVVMARLRAEGCTVQVYACDVSEGEELAQVLDRISGSLPPLRGVVHAAGVLDDGALINQSWDRFRTVLAAKVRGAWNLDRLTAGQPLECFVLFSSMTSLLGPVGQGNHAAANAFLDALAHDRRHRGQPGSTINWGAWSEVGAAADLIYRSRWASSQGVGLIDPAQGLVALSAILSGDTAQVAVMPVDWDVFARRLRSGPVPPLLAAVLAEAPPVEQRAGTATPRSSSALQQSPGRAVREQGAGGLASGTGFPSAWTHSGRPAGSKRRIRRHGNGLPDGSGTEQPSAAKPHTDSTPGSDRSVRSPEHQRARQAPYGVDGSERAGSERAVGRKWQRRLRERRPQMGVRGSDCDRWPQLQASGGAWILRPSGRLCAMEWTPWLKSHATVGT